MADPFVAEVRMFPFSFQPKGWAFCNGQLLPISQNTALFSLLGTTYGGNGSTNFALPNLQGSSPLHPGQGAGLSLYDLGEQGGSETISLLTAEIPAHTHFLSASQADALEPAPTGRKFATGIGVAYYSAPTARMTTLSPSAATPAGGSQPHNNMMPYITFNFCIALQGIFPPRP
jgi:microcystin-dependent protein